MAGFPWRQVEEAGERKWETETANGLRRPTPGPFLKEGGTETAYGLRRPTPGPFLKEGEWETAYGLGALRPQTVSRSTSPRGKRH